MKGSLINSKQEFDIMYKHYILPLLGINDTGSKYISRANNEEKLVVLSSQHLYFYESINSDKCFSIKVSKNFPINTLHLLRKVYSEMMNVRYKNFDESINIKYDSLQHLKKNYEYQLQKGLLEWFSSEEVNLLELLELLEQWKEKTYEGKKVPFAFVINSKSNQGTFPFMDFLEEEYSATFSDGITSIIELDSKLRFLSLKSITDSNVNIVNKLDNVPYRFSQIIETFTIGKIAIFLLVNGDIVLVKNCEIMLVKREGKWLNFNKEVFKSIISAELQNNNDNLLKLLNEIYLSSLDVSFAHSGGIIACIEEEKISQLVDECSQGTRVIHELDDLRPCNYIETPQQFINTEEKKRFLKRNFLLKVLEQKKFSDLDRKLRSELISMDGATILDFDGNIISIGAIIQNDSGSYGGGRGAAAKKLSKYGFAIKISTDGYVEVYVNERVKYRIK